MPGLQELYVAQNQITSLSGYENLSGLKKLHLRRNKIANIDEELPEMGALTYINLRSNKIPSVEVLVKLFQFGNLTDINILKNPVEVEASSFNVLMSDVIRRNTKLDRFCKVKVEENHKLEAIFNAKYRYEVEQAEIKRKAAEDAAKEAADDA